MSELRPKRSTQIPLLKAARSVLRSRSDKTSSQEFSLLLYADVDAASERSVVPDQAARPVANVPKFGTTLLSSLQ